MARDSTDVGVPGGATLGCPSERCAAVLARALGDTDGRVALTRASDFDGLSRPAPAGHNECASGRCGLVAIAGKQRHLALPGVPPSPRARDAAHELLGVALYGDAGARDRGSRQL